jgi:hypothetical protein
MSPCYPILELHAPQGLIGRRAWNPIDGIRFQRRQNEVGTGQAVPFPFPGFRKGKMRSGRVRLSHFPFPISVPFPVPFPISISISGSGAQSQGQEQAEAPASEQQAGRLASSQVPAISPPIGIGSVSGNAVYRPLAQFSSVAQDDRHEAPKLPGCTYNGIAL